MKQYINFFIFLFLLTGIATSGFSQTATYTVTKTTDPDPFAYPYNFVDSLCAPEMYGTLTWAINKANDDSIPSNIVFNISGTGPQTIYLNYALPTVKSGDLLIDGTTQQGYTYANPSVIVDGQNNIVTALSLVKIQNTTINGIYFRNFTTQGITIVHSNTVTVSNSMITGIYNGPSNNDATTAIMVVTSENCKLQGNYIGTNANGDSLNIEDYGIMLWLDANNNLTGGGGNNQGNIIAYCGMRGIFIASSVNDKISRNLIYNNPTAIFLGNGANNNKTAPDSLIYNNGTQVLSGIAEPYDSIEVFGSTGSENANEYLGSTQADGNGNWNIQVQTAYGYMVATATNSASNTSTLSNISNIENVVPIDSTTSYFQFLKSYIQEHPNYYSDTAENGIKNNIDRTLRKYGYDIFPSGDFSNLANNLKNYAVNYDSTNYYHVKWNFVGPFGTNTTGIGQAWRIIFDPHYDNITNKTIYVTTQAGLFRSEDNGDNWKPVTNTQIPLLDIAGLAIADDGTMFLATGTPDLMTFNYYMPNWKHINPFYTLGVYRSSDNGLTWEPINNKSGGASLLDDFSDGGTIRDICINPSNNNQVFLVTTNGVYRTNNALSPNPEWVNIFQPILPNSDPDIDLLKLVFKPDNPNILFLSGKQIYKFDGTNWSTVTGYTLTSDLTNLDIINIAVTPANPEVLYAFFVGFQDNDGDGSLSDNDNTVGEVFKFDGTNWNFLEKKSSGYGSTSYGVQTIAGREPIAVSPVDENIYSYGSIYVWGHGCTRHSDIHGIAFQPISNNPGIFFASDGGVFYSNIDGSSCYYKNNGLDIAQVWSFDDADNDDGVNFLATQDNSPFISNSNAAHDGVIWYRTLPQESFAAKIDQSNPYYVYQRVTHFLETNVTPPHNSSNIQSQMTQTQEPCGQTASFIPETFQIVNHPTTNKPLWGACELFEQTAETPLSVNGSSTSLNFSCKSNLCTIYPNFMDRIITEIGICENRPDYIYLASAGWYSVDDQQLNYGVWDTRSPHLFLTTNGADYSDITSNLPTIPGMNIPPVITGIAVDPNHPERVWITFAGFENDIKVYYSNDFGQSWTNADPLEDLQYLSINGIVYQFGSNDRLYIATDAGVYFKDASMQHWQKYGNMPNVRVTELKINYCKGVLKAATFGRGLWEAPLIPAENEYVKIVSANATWDKYRTIKGNLQILTGVTLVLTGNLTMPEDKQIIIEPGAKLIVDGGTITNGCGNMWGGIVVKGNDNLPQTTTNQGALYVWNGATIENAQTAVTVEGGGVIQASNSNFLNNRYDVVMESYHNPSKPNHNASYFTNCTFKVDNNAIGYCVAHVKLDDVSGIYFKENTFSCEMTEPLYWNDPNSKPVLYANGRSIGIWATDADFKVLPGCATIQPYGTPCPSPLRNKFDGLYYGIKASSTGNTVGVKINNCEFTGNYRSILLENLQTPEVTKNIFNDDYSGPGTQLYFAFPPPYGNSTYGLYLNGCTGYQIQENTFNDGDAGVFVYNSGNQPNVVNNNAFNKISHINNASALTGLGINSGANQSGVPTGLEFKCNNFDDNIFNMSVVGNSTISVFQGKNVQSEIIPAGNTFNPICSDGSSERDFFVDQSSPISMYIYFYDENAPEEKLNCYTQSKVFRYGANSPSHCDIPSPSPQPISEIARILRSKQTEIDNKTAELDSLVDGGDTPGLLEKVNNLTQRNYWTTVIDLLDASPYLSDTVLRAFIYNPIRRPVAKTVVLMANSPLPVAVRNDIDNLNVNYWFRQFLWQLQDGTNPREEKEMVIANLEDDRQLVLNNLMRSVSFNDSIPETRDSLIDVLQDETDYRSLYYLVPLLISNQQYAEAQTAITDLEQAAYNLPDASRDELLDYASLLSIEKTIKETGNLETVVTQNTGFLESLAMADGKKGTVAAQLLLEDYNPAVYDFPEKTDFPNPNAKRSAKIKTTNSFKEDNYNGVDDMLNVYPNPASDKLIVEYAIVNNFTPGCTVGLYDMQGNLIKSIPADKQLNVIQMDVSDVANGNYILSICKFGNKDYSKQISIVH